MKYKLLQDSVDAVTQKLSVSDPVATVILGSGWGGVAENFSIEATISYDDIPCLGATGVVGHAGQLQIVNIKNRQVLIFQGRRHWYEGQGWTPIAFPVYLSASLNVNNLLLTNAAGGINTDFSPGDLMILTDHINAMGANPLIGPHESIWGERFSDQSRIYDKDLQETLAVAAQAAGCTPQKGVYLATSGPTYETPAEIRAYRTMGADAVGMSTVPEAMLANAAGLRVAALSCITNLAAGASEEQTLDHSEVLDISKEAMPKMQAAICGFLENLCSA
ncbi:purine-nucleoside phosphorylase [PVC group bacterium]|nr:purine-nucleoside phosphorylase [PVC group bacterium]